MRLFEPKHAPMQEPELSPAMKARLEQLDDRMDRFERIVKDIRLEWDEMYDKFRLLYARVSRRIQEAAKLDPDPQESTQDAPGRTIRPLPGYGHAPLPIAARKVPGTNYGG